MQCLNRCYLGLIEICWTFNFLPYRSIYPLLILNFELIVWMHFFKNYRFYLFNYLENFDYQNIPCLFLFNIFSLFDFVLFLLIILLVYQVNIAFLILSYQFLHVIHFTRLLAAQECSLVGSFCFSQILSFVP